MSSLESMSECKRKGRFAQIKRLTIWVQCTRFLASFDKWLLEKIVD